MTRNMTDLEALKQIIRSLGLEEAPPEQKCGPRTSQFEIKQRDGALKVYIGRGKGFGGYAVFHFDESGKAVDHEVWY